MHGINRVNMYICILKSEPIYLDVFCYKTLLGKVHTFSFPSDVSRNLQNIFSLA